MKKVAIGAIFAVMLVAFVVALPNIETSAKLGLSASVNNTLLKTNTSFGQNLSASIDLKREEFREGNFTGSLGQFLEVRTLASDMKEFREGEVRVRTNLTFIKSDEDSELRVRLSDGENRTIKIMPSSASQTAIARLKLKVCNESNNCTIQLKETGNGENSSVSYQVNATGHFKILGLFKTDADVSSEVDASTGEVVSAHVPWWASLSVRED